MRDRKWLPPGAGSTQRTHARTLGQKALPSSPRLRAHAALLPYVCSRNRPTQREEGTLCTKLEASGASVLVYPDTPGVYRVCDSPLGNGEDKRGSELATSSDRQRETQAAVLGTVAILGDVGYRGYSARAASGRSSASGEHYPHTRVLLVSPRLSVGPLRPRRLSVYLSVRTFAPSTILGSAAVRLHAECRFPLPIITNQLHAHKASNGSPSRTAQYAAAIQRQQQ